jgi:mycothiol synthase
VGDSWTISPARADEWALAVGLAFQHLPEGPRQVRSGNTLCLLRAGEIPEKGFLVARQGHELLGVLVCLPLKGASGLLWAPKLRTGVEDKVAEALVKEALHWLRGQGAKLAQVFVPAEEMDFIQPLLHCGFRHVTRLFYMRHELQEMPELPARLPRLRVETFQPRNRQLFQETLLRTYQGTLDCPELNGRRTIEEILEGHLHQGKVRPELWWLARAKDEPVAVALVAELFGWEGWDLSYLGVVPAARGRGIGQALTARVVQEAYQARTSQLILAVDVRNRPALQLYEKMGFLTEDHREIFLYFFEEPLTSS